MKMLCLAVISIIVTASCHSLRCCTKYVVPTQLSSEDVYTCKITLDQLINNQLIDKFKVLNCSDIIQVEFLSGIHHVTRNKTNNVNKILTFENMSSVVIEGQPNTIINCQGLLVFDFEEVSFVKIQSIRFENCNSSSGIDFGIFNLPFTKIEIMNCNFVNSRLELLRYRTYGNVTLTVNNCTFENCCESRYNSTQPILNPHFWFIDDDSEEEEFQKFWNNFTFQNLVVQNNTTPFLDRTDLSTLLITIKITGHNYFTNNRASVIRHDFSNCELKLVFSRAIVYFINNTCDIKHGNVDSPINLSGSEMLFEHTYAVFSNNHGHDGGVVTTEDNEHTKIILFLVIIQP